MRQLLLIPAVSLAVCAIGAAACLMTAHDPHAREMTLALLIGTAGAVAALAPLLAVRGAAQVAVSQASLAGTVVQMMLTLALAVGALLGGLVTARAPFLAWLVAFYWSTLAAVAMVMTSAIRHARAEGSPEKPSPAPHRTGGTPV